MAPKAKRKATISPKKNRGIIWPDEATFVLIELWGEETIQLALDAAKCAKETREVYRRITVLKLLEIWSIYYLTQFYFIFQLYQ